MSAEGKNQHDVDDSWEDWTKNLVAYVGIRFEQHPDLF
jgi:hypothetical protein